MKALVVGLGGIGQRHVRNLRALLGDDVQIIAYRVRRQMHVVTPAMSADTGRNVEETYSIRAFADFHQALAEQPDIAFICNPSSLHVPVALDCIHAGCDIFIEKPLSNSLEGVQELIRSAEERKRVAMVGYQLRFHPCVRTLSEIIRSGALGNLLSVRSTIGEYLPNWHPYEDYRQMYAARADQGGGVVLSQIHEFDYLYSLFGSPKRVFAIGGHWSELDIDVEDTASILMEFEVDGRPLPVHLHQDYLQSPPSRQCEVIGDRGKVLMDLNAKKVTFYRRHDSNPQEHSFLEFERNQLFIDQAEHFLVCVNNRSRPIVDLVDGVQSLRMALAAKDSLATRRLVEFEDNPAKAGRGRL
ncbi:Gfo/Idh/MocA family oxidoreductase [Acidobacteria bacterium AB60]|nr:Gfo/Idh/MocA family oxidoreductase [Acidobacteria bacterium AB60]